MCLPGLRNVLVPGDSVSDMTLLQHLTPERAELLVPYEAVIVTGADPGPY